VHLGGSQYNFLLGVYLPEIISAALYFVPENFMASELLNLDFGAVLCQVIIV
jgi:hypothetical protein